MKKIIWKCPECLKIKIGNYKNMTDMVQCLCGFSIKINEMTKNGVAYNCNPKKFVAQCKERYNIKEKERVIKEMVDDKEKQRLLKEIEYMKECQYLGSYEAYNKLEN